MVAERSREEKLKFPVDVHFKIIAENREGMHFVVETVLMGMGINEPLTMGNRSAHGKYLTLNITVRVDSRETMNRIDRELRAVEGVKMVL